MPARLPRIRAHHHLPCRSLIRVVKRAIRPILRIDLEALELVLVALLETAQLLGLAHLQPELRDDQVVLEQLALELADLVVSAPPSGGRRETAHALDQHAAIPGAIEDRDVTARRHVPPEAPQI